MSTTQKSSRKRASFFSQCHDLACYFNVVHLIIHYQRITENWTDIYMHNYRHITVMLASFKSIANTNVNHCLMWIYRVLCWLRDSINSLLYCKGDDASQWRSPKFDPPPRRNPVRGSHKNWQRWLRLDPYTCAKVRHDTPRGFVSAHAWLCAPNCTPKGVSFFGFLQLATAKATGRILTQNTPKLAVVRKDLPFQGREHKI